MTCDRLLEQEDALTMHPTNAMFVGDRDGSISKYEKDYPLSELKHQLAWEYKSLLQGCDESDQCY